MRLKRVTRWLILLIVLDFLIGVSIGYAIELYQRQFLCPINVECAVFGSFKHVALVSIIYMIVISLLCYFFKFRNKLVSIIYAILTGIFLYCLILLSNMYLLLTPDYLEIHDIKNIYSLSQFSLRINYDDIVAFQYKWFGSSGGGRRSVSSCEKKALAELNDGSYINLAPYGFGQGQQIVDVIRQYKNIRINKSVGYEYRSCYDYYER